MLQIGEEICLDTGGFTELLILASEQIVDNRMFHIFQPREAPLQTNLIVMEYIDRIYKPVTDSVLLDVILSMYFQKKGVSDG